MKPQLLSIPFTLILLIPRISSNPTTSRDNQTTLSSIISTSTATLWHDQSDTSYPTTSGDSGVPSSISSSNETTDGVPSQPSLSAETWTSIDATSPEPTDQSDTSYPTTSGDSGVPSSISSSNEATGNHWTVLIVGVGLSSLGVGVLVTQIIYWIYFCCRKHERKTRSTDIELTSNLLTSSAPVDEDHGITIYETINPEDAILDLFLTDSRRIIRSLYAVERCLSRRVDGIEDTTAVPRDGSGSVDDRNNVLLVNAVNHASNTITTSLIARRARMDAGQLRMPLPPPMKFHRRQRRRISCSVGGMTSEVELCLIALVGEMEWLSKYVEAASGAESSQDDCEATVTNRRSAHGMLRLCLCLRGDSSQQTHVVRLLSGIGATLLLSLKTALRSVSALYKVWREDISEPLLPTPTCLPSGDEPEQSCDASEVPWLTQDEECSWLNNPDLYYAELDKIKPGLKQLADSLAIIFHRLPSIELNANSTSTRDHAERPNYWKARLLTSINSVGTKFRALFSSGDTNPDTESDDNEQTVELDIEDDFLWSLDDNDDFQKLLLDECNRFLSEFDQMETSISSFFELSVRRTTNGDVESVGAYDEVAGAVIHSLETLLLETVEAMQLFRTNLLSPVAVADPTGDIVSNADAIEDRAATESQQWNECDVDPVDVGDDGDGDDDDVYLPELESVYRESGYSYHENVTGPGMCSLSTSNSKLRITVDRMSEKFIEDVFDLYDRAPAEMFQRRLRLKVEFIGEEGVDGGGLTREFFEIIFQTLISESPTIRSRQVFHGGGSGHLLPVIDADLVQWHVFQFIGILVVQASTAGCHGLPGMCNGVRQFLVGGATMSDIDPIVDKYVTVDDVADDGLRYLLIQIQNGDELTDEDEAVLQSWLDRASYRRMFTRSTAADAVRRILSYYVFDSRMSQLQAIAEGMKNMNYKPFEFDIDLLFPMKSVLTADVFLSRTRFDNSNYDEDSIETRVESHFRAFVEELGHRTNIADLSLEDLLEFVTGSSYFTNNDPLKVLFQEPSDVFSSTLPMSRTCFSELYLPTVHQTYDDFRQAMIIALELGCHGYGFA